MPLSITGAISASQINTELGRSSTAQFSWNDATFRKLADQLAGAIDSNSARGTGYAPSTTNLNVYSFLSSPATVATYKVLVDTTAVIGGSASTALILGQFPTGSTCIINNYGAIQGFGGAGSSTGGDAINADFGNQTVVINNNSGAVIYGGGGGGGSGGTGGTGGTGGPGYFDTFITQTCGNPGGYTYAIDTGVGCAKNTNYFNQYNRTYTSGGAGGSGGSGGSGGVGQGYNQSSTNGVGGAGGNGGAAGGTNAGVGGTGGTGGTGGNGGAFGTAGTGGGSGSTGGTGSSGNNGAGSAGSGGAGGNAAGSAGRYLVKGINSVTLNNSGTIAGGLA